MQLLGMFFTVSSNSLGACVTNLWLCFCCCCCQTHRGGNFFLREVLPCQNAQWWLHDTNAIIVARISLDVQGFHWNQCQWTNYQTIKYSSEVSQISNKSKQYSRSSFGTIICWSKYILSNFLFTTNNAMYWFHNNALQWYQKY